MRNFVSGTYDCHSRSNWNLEVLVFKQEGKTGVPGEKRTSRSKRETQQIQQTQPTLCELSKFIEIRPANIVKIR